MTSAPRLRVLLAAQAAFMLGFASVVPFIAAIAYARFALPPASIGAIVGLRVIMQQGFFVLGGALTDRFGARILLLIGCAVRAVGFGLIAIAENAPVFLAGVAISGFAGALFSPALESSVGTIDVARRTDDARGRGLTPFAALAIAGEVGGIAGALLGALFMPQHSMAVASAASAVFLLAMALLWNRIPSRSTTSLHGAPRSRESREPQEADVPLIPLLMSASPLMAVYTALFTLIPLQLSAQGMDEGLAGLISITLSVATLGLQWPLSHLSERLGRRTALGLALGIAATTSLAAGAFLLISPAQSTATTLALLIAVSTAVGVALMIGTPASKSLVAQYGTAHRRATRLGALATAGGVLAFLLSALAGQITAAFGLGQAWLLTAALPCAGLLLLCVARRRPLPTKGTSQ